MVRAHVSGLKKAGVRIPLLIKLYVKMWLYTNIKALDYSAEWKNRLINLNNTQGEICTVVIKDVCQKFVLVTKYVYDHAK